MKMGCGRIYQASNNCVCLGRVSCTASILATQALFMVQFPVVAWGLHRDGIIMVSCSAFLWHLHDNSSIYHILVSIKNDGGPHRNCSLMRVIRVPSTFLRK